jgi:hypothetical protein
LALVIARLFESEFDKSATYKSILRKKVLGIGSPASELSSSSINAHHDPFLRSMAHWILEDYSAALETLIKQPVTEDEGKVLLQDFNKNVTGVFSACGPLFNVTYNIKYLVFVTKWGFVLSER